MGSDHVDTVVSGGGIAVVDSSRDTICVSNGRVLDEDRYSSCSEMDFEFCDAGAEGLGGLPGVELDGACAPVSPLVVGSPCSGGGGFGWGGHNACGAFHQP